MTVKLTTIKERTFPTEDDFQEYLAMAEIHSAKVFKLFDKANKFGESQDSVELDGVLFRTLHKVERFNVPIGES